jgi:hypothetical protein
MRSVEMRVMARLAPGTVAISFSAALRGISTRSACPPPGPSRRGGGRR